MVGSPALEQPRIGVLIPLIPMVLGLIYLVAIDQGWLLSLVQGSTAFDMNMVHEFVHDARHAAGFPCH
jgi:cobalt transporter subunit CbtB